MDKEKYNAKVIEKKVLQPGIVSLVLFVGDVISEAVPGQFIDLYSKDKSRMLPRPISICDADSDTKTMRIVFRIAGAGTEEFSQLEAGDTVEVVGPLGGGYKLENEKAKEMTHILLGGGIGIPPMLYLAKVLYNLGVAKENIKVVLGFRDKDTFLVEDFEKYSTVYITSDDGSIGIKGTVIDGLREYDITGDMIYACGPTPMLKGVSSYSFEKKIKAQISLEERMACGVGACLACIKKRKNVDDHSKVNNKRICKDGPVFDAEEVEL